MKSLVYLSILLAACVVKASDYYSLKDEKVSDVQVKVDATRSAMNPTYDFTFNMKDDAIDKDFIRGTVSNCGSHILSIIQTNKIGQYSVQILTNKGMVRGIAYSGAPAYEKTPYFKCIHDALVGKYKSRWPEDDL